MRPSEKAWIGLAASVVAYDVFCPTGETLSEGVDRALEHPNHKYAAIGAIAITGAHLLNILPTKLDPLHQLFRVIKGSIVD